MNNLRAAVKHSFLGKQARGIGDLFGWTTNAGHRMYIGGPRAFWRAYAAGDTGEGLMVLSLLTLVVPWP